MIGPGARALTQVEEKARAVMERHGVREIRVPVLERTQLYQRSTGETSDIVEKQMYVFADRDEVETSVALRPEGTPGVVRAYLEAGLDRRDPEQRFYYSGVMFRRERPQKGRYRQFHQFGVELFGRADPASDAELLIMADELRRELGLKLRFEVNSIGCPACRPAFRAAVLRFGLAHQRQICGDCKRRLSQNPLRLLDCKVDAKLAESAPRSADHLCEACRAHFGQVRGLAAAGGVECVENPRLVRGLDYYTRTTFEIVSDEVGAQSAVAAGGRYDGLVEALGGAPAPGTGFAIGVDRMALALETAGLIPAQTLDAAIIALGAEAAKKAVAVARAMRERNLRAEMLSPERKLKALLGRADRIGARFAVIIGANESGRGVVVLRDLKTSRQREVPEAELAAALAAARGT